MNTPTDKALLEALAWVDDGDRYHPKDCRCLKCYQGRTLAAAYRAAIADLETGFMAGAYARLKNLQDAEVELLAVKAQRDALLEKVEIESDAHAESALAHLFYMGRSKQFQARAEAAEAHVVAMKPEVDALSSLLDWLKRGNKFKDCDGNCQQGIDAESGCVIANAKRALAALQENHG